MVQLCRVNYSDVVSNGCAATKTVWRTWTAIDACGNATNGLQIISVMTRPNEHRLPRSPSSASLIYLRLTPI